MTSLAFVFFLLPGLSVGQTQNPVDVLHQIDLKAQQVNSYAFDFSLTINLGSSKALGNTLMILNGHLDSDDGKISISSTARMYTPVGGFMPMYRWRTIVGSDGIQWNAETLDGEDKPEISKLTTTPDRTFESIMYPIADAFDRQIDFKYFPRDVIQWYDVESFEAIEINDESILHFHLKLKSEFYSEDDIKENKKFDIDITTLHVFFAEQDGFVRRSYFLDTDGKPFAEFNVSKVSINPKLSEKLFEYQPPDEVDTN